MDDTANAWLNDPVAAAEAIAYADGLVKKYDAELSHRNSGQLDFEAPDEMRLRQAKERIQQRFENRQQKELAQGKSFQTEAEADFDKKIETLLKEDIGKDIEAMLSQPVPDYILEALETPHERMKRSEERLEQRQYTKASERDLDRIEMKTGLKLSMELKEGEEGIYRGTYEVAGRSYGVTSHAKLGK